MAKRRGLALDGVLLLDKPVGLSSNHALQRAKRAMDAAKAGHTGTLDPFATGLLVCCMGRATKISGAMLNADKAYRATLQFGEETDSGDLTGNVVSTAAPGFVVEEQALREALSRFSGTIEHILPCPGDGFLLEVVAKRPVAQHLSLIHISALVAVYVYGIFSQVCIHLPVVAQAAL